MPSAQGGSKGLFRRDDHQHLTALSAGMRLDLRDFGRQFGDALKHVQAELGMAHLAAAEAHGHLHLVAFAEEVEDLLHLHVEIRSEEHTSELQSLMRISYAVFCL